MNEQKFIYVDDTKQVKYILETAVEGCYIFIYEKDSSYPNSDYLQDSLEIAISFVEKKFGVPRDKWSLYKES